MVINSYSCENLDGTWRDLLSNVKQKAILSAMWSGLGLQGRKIKELMDGAAPSVEDTEDEHKPSHRGLLTRMGLKHKTKKNEHPQTLERKDLIEFHKKKALFGDTIARFTGEITHHIFRGSNTEAQEDIQTGSPLSGDGSPSSAASPDDTLPLEKVHTMEPMPVLDLAQPLPPEEESSDSDVDDAFPPVALSSHSQHSQQGGPLGLGIERTYEAGGSRSGPNWGPTYTRIDPTKPPDLLGPKYADIPSPGSGGPHWMRGPS